MNFFEMLLEKATVVGSIDLSKYTKVTKFELPPGVGRAKATPEFVTKADLDSLEKVLDRLFSHYNIDITFTKHFKDRINDARNQKQITIEELSMLFRKAYTKVGKQLASMKGREAVLVDLQSKLNVPFLIKGDKNGDLELVSKTIMRKANFQTSNQKLKVEMKTLSEILSESKNPNKSAISFLKDIQKDLPKAITELEKDSFGGTTSVTPRLIGKLVRISDESWYRELFK